jgi:phage baseplate assembly protein W
MSIRKPLPTIKSRLTEEDTLVNSGLTSYNIKKAKKRYSGVYGLAPKLPLSIAEEGSYTLMIELADVVKQNFKNLVLTEPGERIMNSDFGVGLMRYLFEQNVQEDYASIRSRIIQQASKYMPYLNIDEVSFNNIEQEPNYLTVSIYYSIPQLSIEDSIAVSLEE